MFIQSKIIAKGKQMPMQVQATQHLSDTLGRIKIETYYSALREALRDDDRIRGICTALFAYDAHVADIHAARKKRAMLLK
jgi:hypothetical protein